MRCEASPVAGGIAFLEDLGRGHVPGGPCHKGHRQGGRFLGLASDIAGDEGKDEIPLCEVELGAVEGDEETDAGLLGGRNGEDNRGSDDGRAV